MKLAPFATGHNSTLHISVTDEWYIVYHRFSYPAGIKMGRAAGCNCEVCMVKLVLAGDGRIQAVKSTHEGVNPWKRKN